MGLISKEPDPAITWETLRSEHLLATHVRQVRAAKLLGTSDWEVDLEAGRYKIGRHEGTLNILGNTDDNSQTWMHGWRVVEINGLGKRLSTRSNVVRKRGEDAGINLLTQDVVPYADVDTDELAAICASLAGQAPYYQGPTSNGRLIFTLEDLDLEGHLPHAEMPENIVLATKLNIQDHRTAVVNLLEQEGYTVEGNHGLVTAERGDDEDIRLMFDMDDRVTQIVI